MELTDREKAASFLDFKKCDCDRKPGLSFFFHPEKGWCCHCCGGQPLPQGGHILERHWTQHHLAPDMQLPENWFKALCMGYAQDPDMLDRAAGAIAMEVMGMKGSMEALLAHEYEAKLHPPVESKPADIEPVPAAKKVRVRVVGSRRLKRAKSKDQDMRAEDFGKLG